MFDYTATELATIDNTLEPRLKWAEARKAELQQLSLDATRLLSCTENRLEEYVSKGFFKRCWYRLSGKTGAIQRLNQNDLSQMQKVAWRFLNVLQERNLLTAHALVTMKNNLLTLAVDQLDLRNEISRMADRVAQRFRELEDRTSKLETAVSILDWGHTLEARDFDERFPSEHFRLLALVKDFDAVKKDGDWTVREIRYLRTGMRTVGLEPKKCLSLEQFLSELLDEIENHGFPTYSELVKLGTNGSTIPSSFITDQIAVPSYLALHDIGGRYETHREYLNLSVLNGHVKPLREVAIAFVKKQGIDMTIQLPLRDLAVELLHCMRLATTLYQEGGFAASDETGFAKTATAGAQGSSASLTQEAERTQEHHDSASAEFDAAHERWRRLTFSQKLAEADKNIPEALCFMGLDFLSGEAEVKQDVKEAVKYFSRSKEQGYGPAYYFLGTCYGVGEGVERDSQRAFGLFEESTKRGIPDGFLGMATSVFDETSEETHKESFSLLCKARDENVDEAHYYIGLHYENGWGVDKDLGKAVASFELGADSEDPNCLHRLACYYLEGDLVKQDHAKARELLLKAAEKNNAESILLLGHIAEEFDEEALPYLLRAAELGEPTAQFVVGRECYRKGDTENSLKWFKKSAEQGDLDAEFWMGVIREGWGESKEAKDCYKKAEQGNGIFGAAAELRRLYMYLNTEEPSLSIMPHVEEDVVCNAIFSYACDVSPEEVLLVYDDTILSESGKKGFLATLGRFYWNKLLS